MKKFKILEKKKKTTKKSQIGVKLMYRQTHRQTETHTDRQKHTQTDRKVKTEGLKILSNGIFYLKTVINDDPIRQFF